MHRRYIGALGKELAKPENVDALCPVWGKMYKTDIIKENNIQFIDLEKLAHMRMVCLIYTILNM